MADCDFPRPLDFARAGLDVFFDLIAGLARAASAFFSWSRIQRLVTWSVTNCVSQVWSPILRRATGIEAVRCRAGGAIRFRPGGSSGR